MAFCYIAGVEGTDVGGGGGWKGWRRGEGRVERMEDGGRRGELKG